ncbi:MAG: arginine--tRNA ligase [Bacteroidales bacterium]|nr:arginine--tRNA ligase [Bacteroidales bacterium]
MILEAQIATALQNALKHLYNIDIEADPALVQPTRKGFTGDLTVVVFPWVKVARKSPDALGAEIGQQLLENLDCIQDFNVVKGYLNLQIKESFWMDLLEQESDNEGYGLNPTQEEAPVLIEYSSPNTNKPLHLGHIRNNLLGHSVSQILKACGHPVVQVNLVNDRGIHICKSMLAWLKYGNGETPESSGMKGDHLVGKYYVVFDQHYKQEQKELVEQGLTEDEAKDKAPLILEAREMLRKWEAGDQEVRELWAEMNGWVYAGFDQTYERLGIHFDKTYYESQTYLLGKSLVQEGLDKGAFYKHEDGSVRVDLTGEGLDEKVLLRKDGTSVYMTQDLGTAQLRYEEFHPQKMIYVVGNEQNYHFDVLKLVLSKKLEKPFGEFIYHLSYGMVELPSGKMKSREGTVVDADDLMDDMYEEAKTSTEALGKFQFTPEEADRLYEMIGLGALKYFILKVDPAKNMLFNPAESIDFNGNTAPFIQYTHARIRSMLRKGVESGIDLAAKLPQLSLNEEEKTLINLLYQYPKTVLAAGDNFSPALIANYCYDLAKQFNHFYQDTPIFKEEDAAKRLLRLKLSRWVSLVLRSGMGLLGIDVPEKM